VISLFILCGTSAHNLSYFHTSPPLRPSPVLISSPYLLHRNIARYLEDRRNCFTLQAIVIRESKLVKLHIYFCAEKKTHILCIQCTWGGREGHEVGKPEAKGSLGSQIHSQAAALILAGLPLFGILLPFKSSPVYEVGSLVPLTRIHWFGD
jgi:hypothetical protein